MPGELERFMWIFVFFDLPTTEKKERRAATQFRNFLLKDGYMMIQYSVYARVCNGPERVEKHLKRLKKKLPDKGSVRALQITDKQYGRMKILLGNRDSNEKNATDQLLLF
jgi:CRISPR-associated protein Cas2